MPLPITIDDLSTTAALNYPSGADAPSVLDDTNRAHAAFIATLRDQVAKIDNSVYVTYFDAAAGTGTAAIDQAALVAAIASLPAAGGEIHFPVTSTSVYTLTSKPSVGTKKIVFIHHGNVSVVPALNFPDGTHVTGFRQVAADLETDYSGVFIVGDTFDQEAIAGSKVNGFKAQHRFGGTASTGGRHGIYGRLIQDDPTKSTNTDRNYVGVQGHVITVLGDGGTNTGAGSKGAYFGLASYANAQAGATNLYNITGGEFNTFIQAGASVKYKSGLQIASLDEVQGVTYDTLLALSRISGLGNKTGILFGDMNGLAPVATTGTMIATTGTATVDKGIDWRNYTFTTAIVQTDTVTLTSSVLQINATNAGIELGNLAAASTITVDAHSSGNNIDYDVRLAFTGGTGVSGNGALTVIAAGMSVPGNFNYTTIPPNFADDTAAASGGIVIGQMYRTGSTIKVRVA